MKLIRMLKRLRNIKAYLPAIALLGVVGVLLPFFVHAQASTAAASPAESMGYVATGVLKAVSNIIGSIINLLGRLTLVLITLLIRVASYNGYLTSPAVTTGWVIVRDVANMFFVALLLIISIGTIVNPDKFGGVKAVFKVLIFAVFVNFSKTIAGIFIDLSQVVMITFVNGFAQAAGGNFADALGLTKLMEINPDANGGITLAGGISSLILAALMFVIMNVIIGVMLVALVVRMVTLWFLVVVSPLAFALGASDVTKPRYAEWWKRFSAELTTGPTVAFFLWLSLVTVQEYKGADIGGVVDGKSALGTSSAELACAASEFCQEDNVVRFIIATSMMLAGLMFAKEFSGVGGEIAGAAWSKGKGYAGKFAVWSAKRAAVPAVAAAVGGVPLAAGVMALGTQKGRLLAGKYLAGGPVGKWVPGVRGIGLRMQASARREQDEEEKKAMGTMQYATADQRKNVAFSKTATRASRKLATINIAADKMAMQKLDQDPAKRAEMLKELYQAITDEAQYGDEKAIAALAKVEAFDPRVISDLGKRKSAIIKMSINEFISMDIDALTPEVIDMMTHDQREKLYKGGKEEHRTALDAWYGAQLAQDILNSITSGARKVGDLTVPELAKPEVAIKIFQDKPTKEHTAIFDDPVRLAALLRATNARLATRTYAGGAYDAATQSAANGNAIASGSLANAFNVVAGGVFAPGAHQNEDRQAFQNAFHGPNAIRVAFSAKIDEVISKDPTTGDVTGVSDVGRVMAEFIDTSMLSKMLEEARTPEQREIAGAVAKAIEYLGAHIPAGMSQATQRLIQRKAVTLASNPWLQQLLN